MSERERWSQPRRMSVASRTARNDSNERKRHTKSEKKTHEIEKEQNQFN